MLKYTLVSGELEMFESGEESYNVVLKDFQGTLTSDDATKRIKIEVNGECQLNIGSTPLKLVNHDSTLILCGDGHLTTDILEIFCLDLKTKLTCNNIISTITKIRGASLTSQTADGTSIVALDHIWVVDSTLNFNCATGISSNYIMFDNVNSSINAQSKAFESSHNVSVEHCMDIVYTETSFESKGMCLDSLGNPINFIQILVKDENGQEVIIDRRNLFKQEPAKPADTIDYFRDHIGYTNTDLHRRIDQESQDFELPEVDSPNYELGIYSLYSYRTTTKKSYKDGSLISEIP